MSRGDCTLSFHSLSQNRSAATPSLYAHSQPTPDNPTPVAAAPQVSLPAWHEDTVVMSPDSASAACGPRWEGASRGGGSCLLWEQHVPTQWPALRSGALQHGCRRGKRPDGLAGKDSGSHAQHRLWGVKHIPLKEVSFTSSPPQTLPFPPKQPCPNPLGGSRTSRALKLVRSLGAEQTVPTPLIHKREPLEQMF